MSQFWSNYRHPFRLFAFFSLFSLLALRTGDPAYLLFLLFLLFLVPVPARWSDGRMGGFAPVVNAGGRRVVRWHRLALVWVFILSATLFGACGMGYLLVGDWRYGALVGLAMGVVYSVVVTVQGFTRAVQDLPPAPVFMESLSGPRHV